ncbi:MAG: LysE family transporter [Acetobacter sp.]|uniref:LysE family translocator n=1 Tax=Acetobacter sp. TaxID=440 RepID=UPI0039E86400
MNLPQEFSVIAAVSAFWLIAMVVPGLDFLLVTRLAVTKGRAAAIQATTGIAVGVALWGLAGFFGIRALFLVAPWLYLALKIGGGLYLITVGVKLFASSWKADDTADQSAPATPSRSASFRAGLLTNLANPKAPIFVSSLFAASMPQHAPIHLGLACVAAMFMVAVTWFTLVTMLFSLERVSSVFVQHRRWIDRCAGAAFMALGLRFVTERSPT